MAQSGYQRCRERAGLTPSQAAEKLGISPASLGNYESWLEDVPFGVLLAMCHVYACSADELVVAPDGPLGSGANWGKTF